MPFSTIQTRNSYSAGAERSGRRLLAEIGDRRSARAVDIGSRAWSTPLEGAGQWVLQVGYDLFDDRPFRPRGLPWEWQA
jgi:hypothetical protein